MAKMKTALAMRGVMSVSMQIKLFEFLHILFIYTLNDEANFSVIPSPRS